MLMVHRVQLDFIFNAPAALCCSTHPLRDALCLVVMTSGREQRIQYYGIAKPNIPLIVITQSQALIHGEPRFPRELRPE